MLIAVVDGGGGETGARIIKKLSGKLPSGWEILALGTNSRATEAMLEAGATSGASGEGALVWNSLRAAAVAGTLEAVMANSMLGEMTPRMAEAVASSPATRFLLPVSAADVEVAGVREADLPALIDDLVERIAAWAKDPREDAL